MQPAKSTRLLVRFMRSTKTEACANSRLYVHVPGMRRMGAVGAPKAHWDCGKKSVGIVDAAVPPT